MVNEGDVGLIPGSGRAPGEENGNPLQYPCLGNPMDRGAWWATVHGGHKRVGHNLATKQQICNLFYLDFKIIVFFLKVLNEAWGKKIRQSFGYSLKYQSMPSKNALSPCDSLH